jgi:hypothetical protein
MRKWRAESVLDLYNILLALILFVAPWFLAHASRTAVFDLRLSSAAIIILSLAAILAFSIWEEWVNLLLGFWLIVSPWLLGFAHTRAMHYSIAIGAAVAFFVLLDLWLRYERAEREAVNRTGREKTEPR